MVGMLIVSHSRKIAEGVKDLADQMTQHQVPIAVAGGTSDGSLGTNAEAIREMAEQLAATEGVESVLVLVDLGSAVLSAEMAMEGFALPYRLSNAPLVEGAVFGAIEASIGADLDRTTAASEQARSLQKIQT